MARSVIRSVGPSWPGASAAAPLVAATFGIAAINSQFSYVFTTTDLPPAAVSAGVQGYLKLPGGSTGNPIQLTVDPSSGNGANGCPFDNSSNTAYLVKWWERWADNGGGLPADNYGQQTNQFDRHFVAGAASRQLYTMLQFRNSAADNATSRKEIGATPMMTAANTGGTPQFKSQCGSSGAQAIIGLGAWYEHAVLFVQGASGYYAYFINGVMVARVGCDTTSSSFSLANLNAALATLYFNLTHNDTPAGIDRHVTYITSIRDPAASDLPWRADLVSGYDDLIKSATMDFVDGLGAPWAQSGVGAGAGGVSTAATVTIQELSGSGVNPVSKVAVISGSAGQGRTFTSQDDIGTIVYNVEGGCLVVFPTIYVPGGGAANFAVNNPGNGSALVSLRLEGGRLKQGGTNLRSIDQTCIWKLAIYIGSDGTCGYMIHNLTTDYGNPSDGSIPGMKAGRLYPLSSVPGSLGAAVVDVVRGSSNAFVGGYDFKRWDSSMITDSYTCAAADSSAGGTALNGAAQMFAPDHIGRYGLRFRDADRIPGCYKANPAPTNGSLPELFVDRPMGRPGEMLNDLAAIQAFSGGLGMQVVLACGVVNSLGQVTDTPSQTIVTDQLARSMQGIACELVAGPNRFWFCTAVTGTGGAFTANGFATAAVGVYNAKGRAACAAAQAVSSRARTRVLFSDVAGRGAAKTFDGGGVHMVPGSDSLYASEMYALGAISPALGMPTSIGVGIGF